MKSFVIFKFNFNTISLLLYLFFICLSFIIYISFTTIGPLEVTLVLTTYFFVKVVNSEISDEVTEDSSEKKEDKDDKGANNNFNQ